MKSLALIIAAAALTAAPAAARADRCESAGSYAAKFKEAADKACSYGNWSTCNQRGELLAEAAYWTSWWNQMAGNTWAKIGPRQIDFGRTDQGNIVAPGKRLWVSFTPAAHGFVEVKISKKDGKAGLRVHLCAINDQGKTEWIETLDIPRGADNKVFTVRDPKGTLKGKFVAVDMIGDGMVGQGFKYDLSITSSPRPPAR
jgi:hypothetical protein